MSPARTDPPAGALAGTGTSAGDTPAGVAITARDPCFDLSGPLAGDWHGGDPFRTAFFNALSITFPIGERFFIDSVRAFEPDVADARLRAQVLAFIGQEARHRREHQRYNETLCAARGYDLERLEGGQRERTRWAGENLSRFRWLTATVAYEHLTAVIADGILRDPRWLAGADPTMAALWRWHAIEETEHKAVAFDVYRAVGGREADRRAMLRIATLQLLRDVLAGTRHMLAVAGLGRSPRRWLGGMSYLLGTRGILLPLARHWRAYRRPGFHPWERDNRDVLARWSRPLGTATIGPSGPS